ncbi:MAG TPA: hypothetical protein DCY07_06435 [Rhodospirillaceae bacterium]|nr:hypothetical protein [Rhodospirillaceae bacterium]
MKFIQRRLCIGLTVFLTFLSLPSWAQMDHAAHGMSESAAQAKMRMMGNFGAYPLEREASGTSWQPDSSPHEGLHYKVSDWDIMAHGFLTGIYDHQGGKRGDDKAFSTSMAMVMAQKPVSLRGTLGLRAMLSLDPLMGKEGYPLLFAAGETANRRDLLIDRQHPHDLFMELSGSYSHRLSSKASAFLYAGLPGEPALGPPSFMHRVSGADNPEAPLAHHWLDSTHISFGVLTGGYIYDRFKFELSGFNGREPDEKRYNIESPKLNSYAARASYNFMSNLSVQTSWGHLEGPELLEPYVNEDRLILSGIYNMPFGDKNNWATTFAWGRKFKDPGPELDAFMLESAVTFEKKHTFFTRLERVEQNELFHGQVAFEELEDDIFPINKGSLGYIRDFEIAEHTKFGVGGLVSGHIIPDRIEPAYGKNPVSYMLFVRLKIL